jgi:hypothetical protein
MSKIVSNSPERNTFQKQVYLNRIAAGEPVNLDIIDMYDKMHDAHYRKFDSVASRKNNLEYDLLTTDWILDKVRANTDYAQNLYAALCNMEFVRRDLIPYLRQDPDKDLCSYSWRYAGGIIADMRQQGDYIDWYCSGIRTDTGKVDDQSLRNSVPEGYVTEEIEDDLLKLGWIPVACKSM